MKMKLALAIAIVFSMLAGSVTSVQACSEHHRPDRDGRVSWNLSGEVMPVPPYGTQDIIGSDEASRLVVEQNNGCGEKVKIMGHMRGLLPDTEYTVYISNGYDPYTAADVSGSYTINVEYLGVNYPETLVLTQSGAAVTGTLELMGGGSPWTIDSGSVTGNALYLHAYFNSNPSLRTEFTGTINPDGSMAGSWGDVAPDTRVGTWVTTAGTAIPSLGSTGWPGLFTPNVQPFTFTTNKHGAGNWRAKLTAEDFLGPGTYDMSVWVNSNGGTMLISDTFEITVKDCQKSPRHAPENWHHETHHDD